jgi:hypothetical protein
MIMGYHDIATIVGDSDFTNRITACCTEQAAVFVNDQRPDYVALADAIIAEAGNATWFYWLVSAAPGFGDAGSPAAITDPMILSAVQALWPTVAAAHDLGGAA